jgi:hypothetical protein
MPDFPRFSSGAYDMFNSLSRSLSPMRFYSTNDLPATTATATDDFLSPEAVVHGSSSSSSSNSRRRFSVRSDPTTRIHPSSKLRTASSSSDSDGSVVVAAAVTGRKSQGKNAGHGHLSKRKAGFFGAASQSFATRVADLDLDDEADFDSEDDEEESDVEMLVGDDDDDDEDDDDFLAGRGASRGVMGGEFEIFGHR